VESRPPQAALSYLAGEVKRGENLVKRFRRYVEAFSKGVGFAQEDDAEFLTAFRTYYAQTLEFK
jgi:hypothetical protein